MRVVVDTNVLISAAIRDRLPEKVLFWLVGRDDVEWVVSEEILDEYATVIERPKFRLSQELVDRWLELLATDTVLVDVSEHVVFPRDQKDAKFLACARATGAEFMITGDADFEAAAKGGTRVVSVSAFAKLFGV